MKCNVIFTAVVGALSLNIYARAWYDGNLTVNLSDTEGRPITNATVTVEASKDVLWGRGCDDEYNFISANSDSGGVASVDFRFCERYFTWRLKTPSHYSQRYFPPREWFRANVVPSDYCNIDTNTVEGLARYNEIISNGEIDNYDSFTNFVAKFDPKSVTYTNRRIERTLMFYPKRNPQPMYAYGENDDIALPAGREEIVSNGYTVVRYPVAVVDIERHKSIAFDGGTNWYLQADFVLEEFKVVTNGVKTIYGRIVFAPGCGAYKARITQDASFPSTYAADTNAVFVSELPFSASFDAATGRVLSQSRLIDHNEYLVLRTRRANMEGSADIGFHYSKILAPVRIGSSISFRQSVFNPRLNDPNLEFDMNHNLARPKYEVLLP